MSKIGRRTDALISTFSQVRDRYNGPRTPSPGRVIAPLGQPQMPWVRQLDPPNLITNSSRSAKRLLNISKPLAGV